MKMSPREQWILLGIFAVALFLRLAHLFAIQAGDPFFTLPAVDGQEYHARAVAIASGDWMGEGVVILGPFYPHFMALVYALFGPSLFALKLVQAVLGALSCLLVQQLAALYFDRATALVSAGLAAVYGMLVFYGGTVMIVNVMVPLVLLALIAVTHALRAPSPLRWGLAGLAVGAGALARQDLLVFGVLAVGWLVYALGGRFSLGRRALFAAAFTAGLGLMILPFSVRNWANAGDLVLLNSTSGMNLYMGNRHGADGAWMPPPFRLGRVDSPSTMKAAFTTFATRAEGRSLKPSEVSAYWRDYAIQNVREDPLKWLELEARKALLFLNAREIWNNRSIDISRDFSWVLRAPLLTYAVLAPFALLGMGLAGRRFRDLFPLYAMVGTFLATALLFFVLSRYRMGVVPVLLVFAAFAVTTLVRQIRERSWKPVALAVGWLLVLTVVTQRDMGEENLYMAYFNLGNKYRSLERHDEAIVAYDKSLEINADFIGSHNNRALAYEGADRTEEAIKAWRHVYRWSKTNGDAPRYERAGRHLHDLLDLPDDWKPGDPMR